MEPNRNALKMPNKDPNNWVQISRFVTSQVCDLGQVCLSLCFSGISFVEM